MSEHFDGILEDDARSPDGWKQVGGVTALLVNPDLGKLVITGRPNPTHNCDVRGCGSVEHKIAEFDVDAETFEPIRSLLPEEVDA